MSKPSLLFSGKRGVQLERLSEITRKKDHERNTKIPSAGGREARWSPELIRGRSWPFWLEVTLGKIMHLSTSLEHCLAKVTVVMEVTT